MSSRLRLLAVYDLEASKTLSRILCVIARTLGVDAVILLGDTVSPVIIDWLVERCVIPTYGVLGRLDDASVSQSLRRHNGLLEGRLVNLKGYVLTGIGVSPSPLGESRVDVLATYRPGPGVRCCSVSSDIVGEAVESLKPRLILAGACVEPCVEGNLISPGSALKNHFMYVAIERDSYIVKKGVFWEALRELGAD